MQATYTGANARVVEETAAAPIEQQVNGAENMIYNVMDILMDIVKDIDITSVDIQNRISRVNSQLPLEVLQAGITVKKQSPNVLQVISLSSPGETYDTIFLSNYAAINILDQLGRIPGVGNADVVVGKREYSMRLWLRPDKLAKLGVTGGDIAKAINDQNIQAATGGLGAGWTTGTGGGSRSRPSVALGEPLLWVSPGVPNTAPRGSAERTWWTRCR